MTNGVPLIEHVATYRNMYLFERLWKKGV